MSPDVKLSSSRVQVEDSIEAVSEYLLSKQLSDGLPVVPPTEARVRAFVEYTRKDPKQKIAVVAPLNGEATVEKIAVNAVMAGCKKEYMPVLLAAVSAMAEPQFNLNGMQATTNPIAVLVIINGPIRDELNVNYKSGLLGPGWQANATIGRAVRLIQLTLGGAWPGTVDKATQGSPGKYTFCIAENEEENPWEPLHVERGFKKDESTVTVSGVQGTQNVLESSPDPQELLITIKYALRDVGCNNFHMGKGEPGLLLCPSHVGLIKRIFATKNDFKKWVWENTQVPADWISLRKKEQETWPGREINGKVPMVRRWQDWMIMVGGGDGALHSTFLPTFGDTMSVTRRIER